MISLFLFISFGCSNNQSKVTDSDSHGDSSHQDTSETNDSTPSQDTLTLQSEFANEMEHMVEVDDIFAIWWDPNAADHSVDLPILFNWLKEIRTDCLTNLGMEDPPNPAAGHYYNVYIHHGTDDSFPSNWGNGQGTNTFGLPFLTLPSGAHLEHGNVLHEGFHIFQYSANSTGFAYSGDSQWYIEAAAQWYQAMTLPNEVMTFIEAGAIVENPHLALWHSFNNEAPGDPTDWLFQVRQYGMHTWLYYLSEVVGIDPDIISDGFYAETNLLPQAYHFDRVGEPLRTYFADWAAHNTGGLDYLTPEQVERAWLEVDLVGDPNNRNPNVIELEDSTDFGDFVPQPALSPRGWGYNVVKINLSEAASFQLLLGGQPQGSEGAEAHFEGRIVIEGESGVRYQNIDMLDSLSGTASVETMADDTVLYVIVAAVPEHFTGNQTYTYTLNILKQ